jgi:hypothetical protein
MSTLTPPKANIPIGWATIGGQRSPVMIDTEWLRYLALGLFQRTGGTASTDLSSVTDLVNEARSSAFLQDKEHGAMPTRSGDGLSMTFDAAGGIIGINPADLIGLVRSAGFSDAEPQRLVDDSQAMIACQVFGNT